MAFWNKTADHVPAEMLGIDLGASGIKVVRMRHAKEALTVLAADILPPLDPALLEAKTPHLPLPKTLLTNYAALSVSGLRAGVRLLSLPGHGESEAAVAEQIREHIGLNADQRMGYQVIPVAAGSGRPKETRVLVVTLPEAEAAGLLRLVAVGPPAPRSLELSGLAALNAFAHGAGARHSQEAVAFVEAGAQVTLLGIFNKGALLLARKFDFGGEAVVQKVQQQLNVNAEIAHGIISDGSFDISQSVHEVMDPFLRQLTISRDFVERREECRLSALYLSGGMSLVRYWGEELRTASGLESKPWDPFEGMTLAPGALPEAWAGQRLRFSAALGACLGALTAS